MTEYVAGFQINPLYKTVSLIRKLKPDWQRGKLNAIGGKIEEGERPGQAMIREFHEEAGLVIHNWAHFATVQGDWGAVYFFRTFSLLTPHSKEEEQIEVHGIAEVPYDQCIPNLSWLIPLAIYTHDTYAPVIAWEK